MVILSCFHEEEDARSVGVNRGILPPYNYVPLTSSEHEVLELLVDGGTNKAMALKLGVSECAVKDRVLSITQKLYAVNRTHVAALAVILGLAVPRKQVDEWYYVAPEPDNRDKYNKPVEIRGELRRIENLLGWKRLTRCEKRIALFLATDAAEGLTNKGVAGKLNIEHSTFCTHRKSIYRKLNVTGREDMVREIVRSQGSREHNVLVVVTGVKTGR